MSELAVNGGAPVRATRSWPRWPMHDEKTEGELVAALRSGRWAVSWYSSGGRSREREFAERFAEYNGSDFCVSVDHCSSALLITLEALGVGPGDEVIVPGMTWVAPVTSVLRVGALPVVVDVNPESGCVTPERVREALSPKTKAVIVVHLACTVARIDEIRDVAEDAGIDLIEDCSQAHGARWRGQVVGTFGRFGVFSFQAAKSLAGGEGGATITSDMAMYHRMQMLRADSRRYTRAEPSKDEFELIEDGEIMGANYCMSEFTAAVLMDQLARLDDQHAVRQERALELEKGLADLDGFHPVPVPEQVDVRSIYEYGIRFTPGTFGAASIERVASALGAELGLNVYPPRLPLNRNLLLRPQTKRRFDAVWTSEGASRAVGRDYPGAEAYREGTLLFHHSALLGDSSDIADVLTALDKVRTHRSTL